MYDDGNNLIAEYDPTNPAPPVADPNRDWFAKTSDFAAGMGDALSCGLTKRIRVAGGFNAFDENGAWYTGGQVAGTVVSLATGGVGACGRAAVVAGSVRALSAAQGVGSVMNAGEAAANGDYLGAAMNAVGAFGSFGKAGQACFGAGVPIEQRHGCAAIEALRPDDSVLAQNQHDPTAAPCVRRILGTYVGVAPIWHLHVGGRVIPTTGGHPFWVRGQGWTTVAELQTGQELRTGQGGWVRVGEVVDTGRSAPVYNLEVECDHTYFVGDPVTWGFSLWAHNGCNLNSNGAVSKFGVYEIRANGALQKIGKADLNRITQSSGLPTRLHQQVRQLEKFYGKGNVVGEVIQPLGETTTKLAKAAETAHLQDIFNKLGIVPPGNVRSFFP